LARQLPLGVRTMDTVAQIAPDRFGVLLSGAQLTPAFARAEALRRQAAEQVVMVDGPARAVELFIGVAAYPLTSDDAGVLLSSAEHALGEAVATGRGCTVLARVPMAPPPDSGKAP
jgi:diguanylate cyclase (GGDEF)-like protein